MSNYIRTSPIETIQNEIKMSLSSFFLNALSAVHQSIPSFSNENTKQIWTPEITY